MARRTIPPKQPPERPALTRSRKEAAKLIQERIDAGHELWQRKPVAWQDVSTFLPDMHKWRDYNEGLLKHLFTTEEEARKYRHAGLVLRVVSSEAEGVKLSIDTLPNQIVALESVRDRLELFDEPAGATPDGGEERESGHGPLDASKVFIVHGHDGAAQHAITRFVEQLGFTAVVLSEQANKGASILEKLHTNANVGFAIVIITGDDIGALKSSPEKLEPRARQNVILELGFFIGYLGRDRVCPLYEDGVELPSDYHGVGFVPLDKHDGWKTKLAREMQAAGLKFDATKLL